MTISKSARVGLTAAALTAGFTAAAGPGFAVAGAQKVQDIFVTNDASAPVPTKATGTTKVDATGQTLTINGSADVSGSKVDVTGSAVKIDGEVPVRVTNQAADAAQRTPFQKRFFIPRSETAPEAIRPLIGAKQVLEQPAGQRLVITNIAGGGGGLHDALHMFRLYDLCDGGQLFSSLPIEIPVQPAGVWPAFNQPIHFEIAPEHCLRVELRYAADPGPDARYGVTIVGYTVPE